MFLDNVRQWENINSTLEIPDTAGIFEVTSVLPEGDHTEEWQESIIGFLSSTSLRLPYKPMWLEWVYKSVINIGAVLDILDLKATKELLEIAAEDYQINIFKEFKQYNVKYSIACPVYIGTNKASNIVRVGMFIAGLKEDFTPAVYFDAEKNKHFIVSAGIAFYPSAKAILQDTGMVKDLLNLVERYSLYVIALLNVRNISTLDHIPDIRLQNARRKRGKLSLVTYKTLQLTVPGNKGTASIKSVPINATSFHTVRGHFHTYTAEKPMFGNCLLVGSYWIPASTRGTRAQGEIVKDYKLISNRKEVH